MVRMHCLVLLLITSSGLVAEETVDWPGFRGPGATGLANTGPMPETWDAINPNGDGILWKTEVPGLGHSSPTIVGDQIFLATAVAANGSAPLAVGRSGGTAAADDDGEQTWLVLCFDKSSGQELWRRQVRKGSPRATRHAKATHANTTIAVDGDHVVAFLGSEGLHCFDREGNLRWQKDLGVIDISKYGIGWGYASSPAIHDGRIVLVCDDPKQPFVAAFRLSDGQEIWRKSRQGDSERSWGTPLIHAGNGRSDVVVNGWPWIVSYDLETGDERWRIAGGGDNPVPTPFVVNDRLYLTNAHGGKSPIYVLKPSAKGNLSDSQEAAKEHVIWQTERGGSYMSTPVVVGDYLYLANTNGVVRCFHAVTGEKVYEERLGRGACITASLVAADGKIYCPSEDGTLYVLRAGEEFKILAKNDMGDPCFATPSVSESVLYVRTRQHLVAIGAKTETTQADEKRPAANESSEHSRRDGEKRRNVLFIAVDDLRPTLGCYGDPHAISPHIDGLAKRGMQFDRAYCQVAVCNPSRASLMTGLRPDKLGVWTLPIHFREAKPDAVTIPQWFRKFGYTAVSHGKIFHNPTPDPQSWSEPIRRLPSLPDPYPEGTTELVRSAMKELPANDWRKNNLRRPSTAAPELDDHQMLDGARTDMAIEDLRRLSHSDKPFFLAMGYIRPHLAWVAPQKYWDLYDPQTLPVPVNQWVIPNTPPQAPHNNSELSHYVDLINMPKPWDDWELSTEKRRHLMHAYYACVSYVDAQIGRLIQTLDDEGIADETVVVLWSDHGWKLGENRGWGKMTNYEIDTRVPLIVASPGMNNAGQRTDQLVALLDLFPTLCDLVGIDQPSFVDGKSLVPVMEDPHSALHEEVTSQYYRRLQGKEYMGYSMRTKRYRFIEWRDFGSGEVTDHELYDHENIAKKNGLLVETANEFDKASPELIEQLTRQLIASHPRRPLVMTPAVHSNPNPGRWSAELTFTNQSESEVSIYPITPQGRRGRARRIGKEESVTWNARIGGVYVVESADGAIHEIHSPSFPPKPVVIR